MKISKWSGILIGLLMAAGTAGFGNEVPVPGNTPESKMYALNIHYDTGKADIKPQYDVDIKKVADELNNYPMATAKIEGYADSVGTEAYNKELSQKRADNVKQYLVDHYKVDAKRLTSAGFGETKTVADNSTKEGRQRNRVILVTINRLITNAQDQGHATNQ